MVKRTMSTNPGAERPFKTNCDDELERSRTLLKLWMQRMVEILRSLVLIDQAPSLENEDEDQDAASRRQRRKQIVATACLTFLAVYLYRLRRTIKGAGILSTLLSLIINGSSRRGVRNRLEDDYRRATDAPLSLLWTAAKSGQVQRALLLGSQSAIAYKLNDTWRKSTLPPNNPSLQSDLLETLSQGGCTDVAALPESVWSRLLTPTLAALPFLYLALLYRMMRSLHGEEDTARTYENETTHTTFQDVAGLGHVVTEVSEVVSYLSDPRAYHGLGARPPRAVLLYGPPGSGKTLMARAVAGEARCGAFVACSGSDFVDTYVGRGASRVRSLFDKARRQARGHDASSWWKSWIHNQPPSKVPSAVIFIDEIDALARSRGVFSNNDERDQTLNQLLTEMDGFAEHEDVTVIVIAATNRADVLDPAILRRFDRQVHVGYPDAEGRKAILLIHAKRIQCDLNRINWDHLASITRDFSGADLRNVVNDAALLAVRDKSAEVGHRHLNHAVERVRAMKCTTGRPLAPPLVLS